jgi:hypothetical protein
MTSLLAMQAQQPASRVPASPAAEPVAPDWTTQTEWAIPAPDPRLIQPITHYDTGNRPLNLLLNKGLIPWRNLLGSAENIVIGSFLGWSDLLEQATNDPDYGGDVRAMTDMLPLERAIGLTLGAEPALESAAAWTSANLRTLAIGSYSPTWWLMGAGGVGGGGSLRPELQSSLTSLEEEAAGSGLGYRSAPSLIYGPRGPGQVLADFFQNNASEAAADYETRAGGLPRGFGYYVDRSGTLGPVQFDGYYPGTLIEAKYYLPDGGFMRGAQAFIENPDSRFGYDWYWERVRGTDGILAQAERQLQAAGAVPVVWRVASQEGAVLLQQIFNVFGIEITVVYFP